MQVMYHGTGFELNADGARVPFLVTEFAERGSLRCVLDDSDQPIDVKQALQFVRAHL